MQKINIDIPERLLSEIGIDDARAVKVRLEAEGLSQMWLAKRLEADYGIKFVSRSNLSDLLNGRWLVGTNARKIIFCSREILDRYESVFQIKKGEENEKN